MIVSIPASKFARHNPTNNPTNPARWLPITASGTYNTSIHTKFNSIENNPRAAKITTIKIEIIRLSVVRPLHLVMIASANGA